MEREKIAASNDIVFSKRRNSQREQQIYVEHTDGIEKRRMKNGIS